MHLPHWFWRVRFRSPTGGGGETLVVAPHPAGAKQSVAAAVENVTVFENTVPGKHVSDAMANQHFDGYYPTVRATIDAVRTTLAGIGE